MYTMTLYIYVLFRNISCAEVLLYIKNKKMLLQWKTLNQIAYQITKYDIYIVAG